MTDLAALTKEQLLKLVVAQQDTRPYHTHQDGGICHSPYCVSLFDPAVKDGAADPGKPNA